MVSDETVGSLLMGLGGALLIYTIAGIVTLLRTYTGDTGPIVYFFTFIGFLDFLFMGYGLFIIVRAAMSSPQPLHKER